MDQTDVIGGNPTSDSKRESPNPSGDAQADPFPMVNPPGDCVGGGPLPNAPEEPVSSEHGREPMECGGVVMEGKDYSAGVEERGGVEVETEVEDRGVGKGEEGENIDPMSAKPDEMERDEDMAVKQEEIGGEPMEEYRETFMFDPRFNDGDESGTEEQQLVFMKELENFHREKSLEFKPPKFYGEGLNCLKLWRAVTRLGGYDQVTSCKLWRQVGESFKPPKTCTTVSWSFRCFYEKALLEYEKHKIQTGDLQFPLPALLETMAADNQLGNNQASGRARRDAAARAMQGWHSQRLLGNGEVGDPIIKDRSPASLLKREKQVKSNGTFKRKKTSPEHTIKVSHPRTDDPQTSSMVVDVGPPADWVKINVRTTKDSFEVYALIPGLLREEVHVQSDPAGRLVISGVPEQPDNPWGVTPFKKVVTLPSRIDPHQTSAVVTLHGQLFVRAPFEQVEM